MPQTLWLEQDGRHRLGGEVRISVLRTCLEVLAGECSYSSYTFYQRTFLSSIGKSCPLPPSAQLWEGHTPNQPDQALR